MAWLLGPACAVGREWQSRVHKPVTEQTSQPNKTYNYFTDFKVKLQIDSDPMQLIDFLASWTSASVDLESRIVELMKAMAEGNFIGQADVDMAQRWGQGSAKYGICFPQGHRLRQ